VALVYLTRTLPTPWPFYLASMSLSLLLTLWGRYVLRAMAPLEPLHRWAYFTVAHNRWYFPGDTIVTTPPAAAAGADADIAADGDEAARIAAWRRIRSCARHVPLFVNTARTLGAVVLAAQVLERGGDARRPAISTLAALLIGLVPYMFLPESFSYASWLACVDAVLLAAVAGIAVWARMGAGLAYGAVVGVGRGETAACPLNVPRVNARLPLVGCGLAALSAAERQRLGASDFDLGVRSGDVPGTAHNAFRGGPVQRGEIVLGSIFAFALAPIPFFTALVGVVIGLARLWRLWVMWARRCSGGGGGGGSGSNNNSNNNNVHNFINNAFDEDTERKFASACGVMAVMIGVYALCMFPAHYVQQTRPRVIRVFDSVGPATRRDSAAALNGTSWSDWFLVDRPADRLGFFGVWWRERGRRWDTLLAFL
jgi:hypothetical protein